MANNLPSVTTPLPQDLQQFVQRVREALDGGGTDAVVTARQLIAAGIASGTSTGGFASVNPAIQSPHPPTNLSASGALANIIVSWNAPTYTGHAYTEIWAHTSDAIGSSQLVGMTAGNSFAHSLGEAATRYYWARNVNQNGLASAYNNTAGLQAATGTSPSLLLSLLTNQITDIQLYSDLSTRINLIDGASGVSGSVNARILTETNNRTTADTAIASSVTTLSSTVGTNTTAIVTETNNRTTADTAIASSVTTLSSTVGTNTTAISTNLGSVNGLKAQYTVKIDSNGYVSGFGLASTVIGATPTSEFIVRSDKFGIASPSGPGISPAEPFLVRTTAASIGGETVPVGVYMNAAFIQNGTISNAKIGDAAIDSAKIANATIVAADIANATITNAQIASATIVNANIANATITGAKIANATIGTAQIANAAIDNAKIGNVIQSANYSSGSAGWKIDKTGQMEMNNATFRGTLNVASSASSSTSRLEITGTTIKVFEGSTLRVKIGNLA